MTVYEVRHEGSVITTEARTMSEAVLNAADELKSYEGDFVVLNCSGEVTLGIYTWDEANFEC